MLKPTISGLLARRRRLFATALAVLLGVAFVAGTFVLTDTIKRTFHDLFGSVYVHTDAVVRGQAVFTSDSGAERPRVDAALVRAVAAVPGVRAAEGNVFAYAQLVDERGAAVGEAQYSWGLNWNQVAELNPFTLVAGRAPQAEDEIVINKAAADDGGFAVGDAATVLVQSGRQRLRVAGIARFGTADSISSGNGVLFTQAAAQRLIAEPGRFDDIGVVADPGVTQERLRDRLAAALPGAEVVTGKAIVAEWDRSVGKGLQRLDQPLLALALISLFVGSFIIYNTFSILVAQRGRELALLRAVGASRRQVLGSVLLEAVVVGLLASLGGVAAGVGVAVGLRALLTGFGLVDIPAGGLVLAPRTVVVSLLTGVLVSAAAAILPARKAAKAPPVAAMRDLAQDSPGPTPRRVVVGGAVTAAGVASLSVGLLPDPKRLALVGLGAAAIFIGVAVLGPVIARPASRLLGAPLPTLTGMPGTLARENTIRNPKRTATTAAALMIGVSLVAFIAVYAASAKKALTIENDQTFTSDFRIDTGTLAALSPDLAERLARLPEVAVAAGVRTNQAQVDGAVADLAAVDPAAYGRIVDLGVTGGRLEDLGRDGIAVADTVARAKGWSVGEAVEVRFAETGPRRLTVAATFGRGQELGSSYLLGLPAYEANFADRLDSRVLVTRAQGVAVPAARAAVERVTADYPTARVQDRGEYERARSAEVDRELEPLYVMLALAVLIALLGIANTLALSVFERTRELGLLRAVGMARRQVRAMVRGESVVIALFGTCMGLVIGLFFGWAVVAAVPDQAELTVPVAEVAVGAVLAALAGVVAAILPARRAARLDVLTAISTE
jgi:putative ABC transport system permease protein